MKKILYILTTVLFAGACTSELDPIINQVNDPEEGAKVTVEFSVPTTILTKAGMTHAPEIETIHIAVFNKSGLLKEYVQAELTNASDVKNGPENATATFTANLTMALTPRIVHFIANSPYASYDDLPTTTGEQNVIQSLITEDGDAAYWQRFELDKIDAFKYPGGAFGDYCDDPDATSYSYTEEGGLVVTVNIGDYVKRDGRKVLDGTGYFASTELSSTLALVPLVRNFAEISVKSLPGSNLVIQYVGLGNVPTAGFVAAFQVGTNKYASIYTNATAALSHNSIKESGYLGTIPENAEIDTDCPTPVAIANWYGYMYERPVPTADPTCILVGGTLNGGSQTRWFKIEISDPNGAYFPIYRGVSYEIEIGQIEGSDGYGTASAAWDAPAIGDISNSVETKTLEHISDGNGTTLWVEYIDNITTNTSESTVDIYYTMFYKNPSNPSAPIQYLWDDIDFTVTDSNYPAIQRDADDEPVITVAEDTYTTGTPDATKNWKKATIALYGATNNLKSVLKISGKSGVGKEMFREVTYRVIGELEFTSFTASPLNSEDAGQTTTLTINLPADLGYSMFPLVLKIEAANNAYNSTEGLPVESGPSLFNSAKNSFYFLKTINYSDYYDAIEDEYTLQFTCSFKTTKTGTTANSNATTFRVIDKVKTGRTTPYFAAKDATVTVNSTGN